MRVLPLALVLGVVALSAAPFASAAAAGCAVLSPGSQVNAATAVFGPFLNFLGGACNAGVSFNSTTPACPLFNTAPAAVLGAYCGPYLGVPFGATRTCTAAHPAAFTTLVLGLDRSGTGNIGQLIQLPDDHMAYDGVAAEGYHTTQITNVLPTPATVIAYPVGVQGNGPIYISCV